MKRPLAIASAAVLASSLCCAETINFDRSQGSAAPVGWTIAMTHTGGLPKWEVQSDASAPSPPNVLTQVSADRTAGRFPLAIWNRTSIKDGTVTVKFKTISGIVDQAAGLVWRYRDPGNYYIVRANALEDNVVLYKVQNGERAALAPKGTASNTYGVKHKIPKQTWASLSVSFHGTLFTVRLNGEQLFEVEDSTFAARGKTGLWTKADSVTSFDDFQVVQEKSR